MSMRKLAADSGLLPMHVTPSSREACMARTGKRTFGVSAVGILMTIMMEVTITVRISDQEDTRSHLEI